MWLAGLVAPQYVGSSRIRAQTRVPRIGRRILNHCATREAPLIEFNVKRSTFFLHVAQQAAELSESSGSWLLWILLVSLLHVAAERQAQVVFADRLVLQRYKEMKWGELAGETMSLAPPLPWVPALPKLGSMATVTPRFWISG